MRDESAAEDDNECGSKEVRPGEVSVCQKLCKAIDDDDVLFIRELLCDGYGVNDYVSEFREKMIHRASALGRDKIVYVLCKAGADLNARDWARQNTPLVSAAERGHVETARVLMKYKADLNEYSSSGMSVVEVACVSGGRIPLVVLLLKAGARAAHLDGMSICHHTPRWLPDVYKYRVACLLLGAGAPFRRWERRGGKGLKPVKKGTSPDMLKDLCVDKIRSTLSMRRRQNLYCTVPKLGKPKLVQQQLLLYIDPDLVEYVDEATLLEDYLLRYIPDFLEE